MIGQMRRNAELGLILLGVVITGGAYTLASLGRTSSIPANIGPFLGVVFALLITAHIAVRRLAPSADGILLPVAALLNGIGYVFIVRLSKPDQKLPGLQATWTAVGILAFIVTLIVVRRVRDLERYRYTFALIGLALLIMPLVPGIGVSIFGSQDLGAVRPGQLPARRVRQDRAGHLLRRVSGGETRAARHGDLAPLPADAA